MKFGIIKSKIESILLESYIKGSFKTEIQNFKSLVLNNKNISKLYYLYDDLTSNKGINESIVNDYISESVLMYEKTIKSIKTKDLDKINNWIKDVNVTNSYENIDNLFSNNILTIEEKVKTKKVISETLKKSPVSDVEGIEVPISVMVNVANKTINKYIDTLNESEKKELHQLFSISDEELEKDYNTIKESVITKLIDMEQSEQDDNTKSTIKETLDKVTTEKYDKLNYYKLKSLNKNI